MYHFGVKFWNFFRCGSSDPFPKFNPIIYLCAWRTFLICSNPLKGRGNLGNFYLDFNFFRNFKKSNIGTLFKPSRVYARMEEITLLMFILAIAVFLLRYYKKVDSLNYLSVLLSLMALFGCLRDSTLDNLDKMFIFFPTLFILLMALVSIATGERKRW